MEKILKYSVLRYSPSAIAGEKINLGIIFSDEAINYREFKYSKRFSRLSNFDDEIDISLVKAMLKGIKEEVSGNLFTYNRFDIEEFTRYYVNDFAFDKPKAIIYDDLKEIVERLNRTYFRFDYEKAERPSKDDDKKLIGQIISMQNDNVKKNQYVLGESREKIKYDFITDKYKVKVLDFDNKDLKRIINNAKAWAWNCMYDKDVIIIYRHSDEETNRDFDIILDIFNKAKAKIYSLEEGIQQLQYIQQ